MPMKIGMTLDIKDGKVTPKQPKSASNLRPRPKA